MAKILKICVVLGILTSLAIAYWLGSPLFINKKVSEKITDIQSSAPETVSAAPSMTVVAQGNFIGADNFHKAEGTAKLIKANNKYFIRLEDDFKTTNGPDLFVYFGKNGAYAKEARVSALKGNIGSQNYEVPENINPVDYTEVWIWCRAFFVPFGHASLQQI